MLSRDPVGPRITYYDDASGERIELSTVTLANWAAKTANLLRDELGAGPDSRVAVLLPAHWQTAAVLLGIWYIGAEVVLGPGEADVALCTADRFADAEAAVGPGEIAVLSLDPFGKPVADLPVGVTDYATSVRVHGDQIIPERQPGPALDGRSVDRTPRRRRRFRRRAGLHRRRPGAVDRAVGHRRRTDRQLPGGARRGCFAGAGGQSRSVGTGTPPPRRRRPPGARQPEDRVSATLRPSSDSRITAAISMLP